MRLFYLLVIYSFSSMAEYFLPDYRTSREDFRKRASLLKEVHPKLESGLIKVPGHQSSDLSIDWIYLPAHKEKKNFILITTGVHGIESFATTSILRMFMSELLLKQDFQETAFLLIHAINPYGFEYKRRVTENNVDLNRSFIIKRGPSLRSVNPHYSEINHYLNPTKKVSLGPLSFIEDHTKALFYVLTKSKRKFRQAVLQGQYRYPKGVFYGGEKQSPQQAPLRELIEKYGLLYSKIFAIDLHTGYGKRGHLHFFGSSIKDSSLLKASNSVFKGYLVDRGSDEDFYSVSGDITQFIHEILSPKFVLSMTFEYGTLDSQTISGSLESLRRTRLENQGAHFGFETIETQKLVLRKYKEAFSPSDLAWRESVLKQSREIFPLVIQRFQSLPMP